MDYESMSKEALKKLAKEKNMKGYSTMTKPQLVELLKANENTASVLAAPQSAGVKEPKTGREETGRRESVRREPTRTQSYSGSRGSQTKPVRTEQNAKPSQPQGQIARQEARTETGGSEPSRLEQPRPEYTRTEPNRSEHRRNEPESQPQSEQRPVRRNYIPEEPSEIAALDSGETKEGILEVMSDGYGFIRCDNYLPGENDVYVSPAQIRHFNLKTGDIIIGNTRIRSQNEKFSALLYLKSVNGFHPSDAVRRPKFEDLTPIFPNRRLRLETQGENVLAMRMVDLLSPIGKGQRGMIVSQPKAGKTTLLKQVARSITKNYPEMYLLILLIDERPEEVTDMKESIEGEKVEVIYSTFDELPENHKRVSEMVIERAKRLVEHKKDVVILLDSITRLARAYNLTVQPSGRTLSGGLDPAALHMPKRFFGAARNMREGGSLTILATALVETGSRMDDVVFEEFKGTGNMEIVLDRGLSEKKIFPAIDLAKSSTRRDDLLFTQEEAAANLLMKRALSSSRSDDAMENIIKIFKITKNNHDTIEYLKKNKII